MPTQVNSDYPFMSGPASSVLNDIAIFSDTTGKLLKDNAAVVARCADLIVTSGHVYFVDQTAASAMLKRNGTAIQVRLGDDSLFGDLNALNVSVNGGGTYYADNSGTPVPGINASVVGSAGLGTKTMTFMDGILTGFV